MPRLVHDASRSSPADAKPPDLPRSRGRWRALRGWAIALGVIGAAVVALRLTVMRPRPVDVRVARVARGTVEETVSSTKAGSLRSRRSTDLSAEVAGSVAAIHAREGTRVRRDDVLVSLNCRDPKAAHEAARRELHVLESLLAETRARRDETRRERERLEGLRAAGSVSRIQIDQADTQVAALAASLEAADARVQAHRASMERAGIAVDKCEIRAPFDGVVVERYIEIGEWAVPGRVALRLLDPEHLYVRAELDEVDLAELRVDLHARVTLDPYRDRRLAGRVTRVAPYVSEVLEQNRTVTVEVEIADSQGLDLRPGTSADVEVILRKRDATLRIPTSALMEGRKVLTIGADGRARAASLKIGLRNWEYAEVLGGLRENDPVVVSLESEKVKEGVLVRIAK